MLCEVGGVEEIVCYFRVNILNLLSSPETSVFVASGGLVRKGLFLKIQCGNGKVKEELRHNCSWLVGQESLV
jgi:hypothetical protein